MARIMVLLNLKRPILTFVLMFSAVSFPIFWYKANFEKGGGVRKQRDAHLKCEAENAFNDIWFLLDALLH